MSNSDDDDILSPNSTQETSGRSKRGKDGGLSAATLNLLQEGRSLLNQGTNSKFHAQFRASKGSTIERTGEIIRALGAEEGGAKNILSNEAEARRKKAKVRLATLYATGVSKAVKLKGKKRKVLGDERDYEFSPEDLDGALSLIEDCPALKTLGASRLENAVNDYAITIFEVISLLDMSLSLRLTQRQTAALVDKLNAREGQGCLVCVNYRKLLTGIKRLGEELRDELRMKRREEVKVIHEKQVKREEAYEPYRGPEGEAMLADLANGLHKLSQRCRNCWLRDEGSRDPHHHSFRKLLSMDYNANLDGAMDSVIVRDFCRQNLRLKLSLEECDAIVRHVDHMGYGTLQMDFWLHQLKLLGLGKSSVLSPLSPELISSLTKLPIENLPRWPRNSSQVKEGQNTHGECEDDTSVMSAITDENYSRSLGSATKSVNSRKSGIGYTPPPIPTDSDIILIPIPKQLISEGKLIKEYLPKVHLDELKHDQHMHHQQSHLNKHDNSPIHDSKYMSTWKERYDENARMAASRLSHNQQMKEQSTIVTPIPENKDETVSAAMMQYRMRIIGVAGRKTSTLVKYMKKSDDDVSANGLSTTSSITDFSSPIKHVPRKNSVLAPSNSPNDSLGKVKKSAASVITAASSSSSSSSSSLSSSSALHDASFISDIQSKRRGGILKNDVTKKEMQDSNDADELSVSLGKPHKLLKLVPTSIGHRISGRVGGSACVMRVKTPILTTRSLTIADQSTIAAMESAGGGLGFGKTTKDSDTRRWLNENFARLPLDDKAHILRYSLRWSLIARCIKNMKRFNVSPNVLCDKLRKSAENYPPPKVDDPLADVGVWVKRDIFVEDMVSMGISPSVREANKLFSALDPHKKNFIPTFEIAALFNVFYSIPWATPWSSNAAGDSSSVDHSEKDSSIKSDADFDGDNSTSSMTSNKNSKGAAADAIQITEAIVSAACIQLDLGQTSALPQTVVETCMLCICCSRQAESDMISLFSLIFNAIKGFNVLLPSNLGTGSIKCISIAEVLSSVKSISHLKKHIEKEWAEASYAASLSQSQKND